MADKLAIHIGKYKKDKLNLIWKHNMRLNKNYKNKDIDINKRSENIIVKGVDPTLYKATKKHIENNVTGRVNSSSTWIVEAVVFSPQNISKAEKGRYYNEVVDWLEQKFGRENVLLAVAHFDESGRDHAHIDICPILNDGRLSAKEMFNRNALECMHTELAAHLKSKGFDVERGTKAKGKKLESLTYEDYKKKMETQKEKLQNKLKNAKTVAEQLEKGNVMTAQKVLENEIYKLNNAHYERVR